MTKNFHHINKKSKIKKNSSFLSNLWTYLKRDFNIKNFVISLIFDPNLSWFVMCLLFVFEIFLNILIINKVNYTEIDWSTYMQQVQCFLNGTRDYKLISGDTGPIVYPAGHLYAYTILFLVTDQGNNIRRAQYIFLIIYLITLVSVFRIYLKQHAKLPPYVFVFMCFIAYRIHSIYVLRLFNDTIAMTFLYIAINLFIDRRWIFGCFFYSLAVSVKMNILLFSPALLLILLCTNKFKRVLLNLFVCAFTQLVIGLPFLINNPMSYIISSFNFGRVFLHKWTVNWRFLPEYIFVNNCFHVTLLVCHLIVLLIFFKRWFNINKWFSSGKSSIGSLSNDQILLILFTANIVGISFSRSLHYQFYSWYFHSVPFLLWSTSYKPATKLCIWGLIELSWNTFPSTNWSSGLLHFLHFIILTGLWKNSNIFNSKNSRHQKSE